MAPTIKPGDSFTFIVTAKEAAQRLDNFLASHITEFSRSYFQKLIEQGAVTVNTKKVVKPSYGLKEHDIVIIQFPLTEKKEAPVLKQELGVQLVYEHPDFLIINKPAGLTVHAPSKESMEITLVDWLLNKFHEIAHVGVIERPGIVHRLDKDTSGLLIVPRNNYAHMTFGNLFKDRQIKKTYLAIAQGHPEPQGTIDFAIMRHPVYRAKMTHIKRHAGLQQHAEDIGRHAITHYKVLEYFNDAALVEVKPVTGRTHQIRVHFAAIGHPLLGDTTYGKASPLIKRHALHAAGLAFDYEGEHCVFTSEPPQDFDDALRVLRSSY